MRNVDLVLIGFGNVARRFVTLLDERRERLAAEHQLTCRIVGEATRRAGAEYEGTRCADAFEVIERLGGSSADLRIVVETTTLDVRNATAQLGTELALSALGLKIL